MTDKVLEILKKINSIISIDEVKEKSKFKDKFYDNVIKFTIKIKDQQVAIVMGIPADWEKSLLDIFIENYMDFKLIPHMYNDGKICLFDLEGVLLNINFDGLVTESINRLERILVEGIDDSNKLEFITEFDAYWNQLPDIGIVNSSVLLEEESKKIKYTDKYKLDDKRFNLSASDKAEELKILGKCNTVKNGIYIYIKPKDFIYPPDWRKPLDITYINQLLEIGKIEHKKINNLIKHFNDEFLLLINISQPNGFNTPIAILVKNYKPKLTKCSKYFKLNIGCRCIPLGVCRNDSEYLIKRGGIFTDIKDKKVLIVGCGSIGGYLASELVKAGISNICLVDKDRLSPDNIYRHLLGLEFVGQYKTKAIIKHLENNIPYIRMKSFEDNIENLIENYKLDFEEFDLIISATGNHNVNRWINNYCIDDNISVPVIYLWNEVLGIGNHALFIDRKNKGCFECLIGLDENGLYDKTSYCKRGQVFTKKYNGCHSTFLPFGSIHSLKTVAMGVELSLKYFNGEIEENCLISQKGEDIYMKKEGLLTSDRYKYQKNDIWKLSGSDFMNINCNSCSKEE